MKGCFPDADAKCVGNPIDEALARLTIAQAAAVRRGSVGPTPYDRGPGYWPLKNALIDKGLFTVANGRDVLTDWGRMIQARLREIDA